MTFTDTFLTQTIASIAALDQEKIDTIADVLYDLRQYHYRRLFILGVGGSAGHASHAVNDFRKICGIEAYAPTDNVSELTARTNDEGFETFFVEWLKVSNLNSGDVLLFFSVGGGDLEKNVSVGLINAAMLAHERGSTIISIVGKEDGYLAKNSDYALVIPVYDDNLRTPLTESITAVVWHLLVSHPKLKKNQTKWEGILNKPVPYEDETPYVDEPPYNNNKRMGALYEVWMEELENQI